ncbi:MAG: pantoate--beta-alanine ligase [Thiotrichales bacterium 32-46-8]|nr:MAG: pantoate--beta-alanine ligase [Thiotrichales bacterium 32-46-8]
MKPELKENVMKKTNAKNYIYRQHGYNDREDYLSCIAEDYGVPLETVEALADMLGPNEDFDCYPRTLDADVQALSQLGVDVVFAPNVDEVYPERGSGSEGFLVLPPPKLTDILCGESRPGHFTGVATIVLKLFNMIQPQLAVFGEKDYQQLAIIKAMVRALNLPIKIISAPTCRAADGLALSSRNQYLSTLERQQAPAIYQTLQTIGLGLHQGQSSEVLIEQAQQQLIRLGFNGIDYIAIRHPKSLEKLVQLGREGAVVLIAARLGNTRLIDNLLVCTKQ